MDINIKEIGNFFARRAKFLLPTGFLSVMVPSLMFTSQLANPNVSVVVNGEYVGMVETQQYFEQKINDVEMLASDVLGKPYKLNIETQYIFSYGGDNQLVSDDYANEVLSKYVTGIAEIATIYVDGVEVGSLKTREEAEELLEEILLEAVGDDSDASFVQDVEVKEETSSASKVTSTEKIKEYFSSTAVAPSVHVVAQNQTLSEIANSYGMKTQDIVDLNPQIEPTRMQIGQDILIEKAQPAVSISVVKTETYAEAIAYTTNTTYDDSMTTTQKTTQVQGVEGEKEIVAQVTYIDDIPVETIILSENITREPVTAEVTVGTKKPVATGNLKMPTTGILSSSYGYRSSGFHTGIDIANSYGTRINAADGGTVTFAGWNGGYGYCVIINHGNGIETLYAHASKLNVSVGDKVTQGDKIAEMGSTGNSTGNHLHFEVRVNGNHQNPYNYL